MRTIQGNKGLIIMGAPAKGWKSVTEYILISDPPPGKMKITNMYYDPDVGKIVVKYDDNPA
jgi:hypothetical protein